MIDFTQLIQNENMKIYRRLRTVIMFILILMLNLLFGVLFSLDNGPGQLTAWDAVDQLSFLYFLVVIFSTVVAADIVAGEFTWGTIKLLLIRPWTRSKILGSKLLSVICFTLLLTAWFLVTSIAISFILFPNQPSVIFGQEANPFAYIMEKLLYSYIDLLVITIFSFMISTVFRSGGIAIGLSMFILFTGNIFTMLFNPIRYPWAKYMLFTNMDLSQYQNGGGNGVAGMSLGFSSVVLAAYIIIFLLVSWVVFNKRDVAT
ncbi:ABC-2 family transporter protein [compost metagenome]